MCKCAHLTVGTRVYEQRRDYIYTLYECVQTEKNMYTIPPQAVELLAINADHTQPIRPRDSHVDVRGSAFHQSP